MILVDAGLDDTFLIFLRWVYFFLYLRQIGHHDKLVQH